MSTRELILKQVTSRILRRPHFIEFAILLLLCFLCGNFCKASVLPNYFTRFWQTENGLPDNNVTSVLQTHDGYIWLGTRSGLVRFDGVRFTVFDDSNTPEMQSRNVTCLFEANDGTLWIGYETGEVASYKAGKFQAVALRAAWRGGKILAIGADVTGDIWLLNQYGDLMRVKDGLVMALSPAGAIAHLVAMAQNPKGGFWIQRDNEVSVMKYGQLKPLDFGLSTNNNYIQGISASRDGGLWVMANQRIQKWKEQKWIADLGPAPWGTSPAHTVIETTNGYLAVATVNYGFYLIFPGKGNLQFCRTNGFSSDWVTSLCEDREGNLWAGTGNGGLAMLRAVNVTTLNPPDHWQGRAVLSVASGQNNSLWIGTEGAGLYRFQNGDWKNFDESAGISHRYIWSVTTDVSGGVWAGSWGNGVFVWNGTRFENPPELQNLLVGALTKSPDGLLVGTKQGLFRYESGKVTWLGRKSEPLSPDVRVIAEQNNGTIWFGMSGGGLGRFKNGTFQQFRRRDGLSSDFVQCFYCDSDGALWIGTFGGGIDRLQNGRFAVVTKKQGLPNDIICNIQDDGRGFFWISSHDGIARINKTELNRCANGETNRLNCLTYDLSDGLPSLECSGESQPAGCKTADGHLWFPTAKGLVGIDPADVKTNQLPPPVMIEEVLVDGQPLTSTLDISNRLQIAPGRHRLEIDYTGLSFAAPEKMRFKYRLDGLERDWVDADTKRMVNYNYIPPGDYVFRVIACNNDGVWNNSGAKLAFTVLPFFWQTLWFRITAAAGATIFIGGSVLIATRRRMRQKLERLERQQAIERERTRIAKDIHDDLGASLTRITLLSQSVRSQLNNSQQAAEDVNRIYTTARELTRAMDEIVWAVNPRHDSLDSLASYLGKFAQDYLRPAGIRCRLNVPVQLPHWSLTAEARHNLFLSFKEALHNVVKHAGASEVSVSLILEADSFSLIVEDNGRGFLLEAVSLQVPATPDRIECGNGLANMRHRLAEIGGCCKIQSALQVGTTVSLDVPIKKL